MSGQGYMSGPAGYSNGYQPYSGTPNLGGGEGGMGGAALPVGNIPQAGPQGGMTGSPFGTAFGYQRAGAEAAPGGGGGLFGPQVSGANPFGPAGAPLGGPPNPAGPGGGYRPPFQLPTDANTAATPNGPPIGPGTPSGPTLRRRGPGGYY